MLGDEIRQYLPELRSEAESLMVDTCVVTRAGEPVWNPVTGLYEPSVTTVYSGPCQLRNPGVAEVDDESGHVKVVITSQILTLAWYSEGIEQGDVAVVSSDDPQADDMRFEVVGIPASTWAVCNDYNVKAEL